MEQMTSPSYENRLPPFLQEIFDKGKLEGKMEAEERARIEGQTEGEEREERAKIEAKQEVLLLLVSRLGFALSDEDQSRIAGCTEMATLDRWIVNALDAKVATDIFR